MYLRRNILPKTILDAICSGLLIVVFIPYIYWYELFEVLPHFYEIWSFWYIVHWLCGNFVAFQIVSNLVAIILCDTSVKGRIMPTTLLPGWRFCSVCETIVPPRSWHCEQCNTCILRRDHHCLFTSCCIGHDNHRYFFIFVFYTFIALLYSFYFNCYYTWEIVNFTNVAWINIVFPLAMVFYDYSPQQLNLLVFLLLTVAMFICASLLYLHLSLIRLNQVTYERGTKTKIYNMGLRQNITSIFGERWKLCWLSSFIQSELTHDGMNWIVEENVDNVETEKTK